MTQDSSKKSEMACHFRVYHRDIDMHGLVHTGVYVSYFESAANDMLRHFGVLKYFKPQPGAYQYVVRRIELVFHKPISIDELLHVRVALSRIGTSSLVFSGRIDRDEDRESAEPSVSASFVWVYVDADAQSAAPIPEDARTALASLTNAVLVATREIAL
jgi:acyl-CoA thioester hydrolase